jgi:predicted ATPase
MMVYAIYPDVLREPQKYSNETPMQPRGENWVSILYQQEKHGWKPDLVSALEKLTGDIDDVKVAKASGFLITQFHHKVRGEKTKKWFGADLESDGTLRVAGLLTALLQTPPLTVIGIEEPELTVHPGALPLIYDYLREASSRSQIFVTTHSPILLDHLDLDDSTVFVVQRSDTVSSVYPLSTEHKDAVRKQLLTLGEIMISGDLQLSVFPD